MEELVKKLPSEDSAPALAGVEGNDSLYSTLDRNGKSSGGSSKWYTSQNSAGPKMLCEMGSARLNSEGTKKGVIIRLAGMRQEVMHWIEALHGILQECPFL
jgi:hypothetical protein